MATRGSSSRRAGRSARGGARARSPGWRGPLSQAVLTRAETGRESPAAKASPRGITVAPDDALWFTEFNANKIGRITTAGAFHEYTLPIAASGPIRIAAGADGNLWVTQTKANEIARVTPTGSVTEYPLPSGATPA